MTLPTCHFHRPFILDISIYESDLIFRERGLQIWQHDTEPVCGEIAFETISIIILKLNFDKVIKSVTFARSCFVSKERNMYFYCLNLNVCHMLLLKAMRKKCLCVVTENKSWLRVVEIYSASGVPENKHFEVTAMV